MDVQDKKALEIISDVVNSFQKDIDSLKKTFDFNQLRERIEETDSNSDEYKKLLRHLDNCDLLKLKLFH